MLKVVVDDGDCQDAEEGSEGTHGDPEEGHPLQGFRLGQLLFIRISFCGPHLKERN